MRSDTFVNKQTRSGFRAPPSCLPVFFFSSHSVCDGQTLYCVQIFFLNLIYDLSSHFYLIYDLSFHLLPNVWLIFLFLSNIWFVEQRTILIVSLGNPQDLGLFSVCLSACLSSLSVLSACLSSYLFICLSVRICVCLFSCLLDCLSVEYVSVYMLWEHGWLCINDGPIIGAGKIRTGQDHHPQVPVALSATGLMYRFSSVNGVGLI